MSVSFIFHNSNLLKDGSGRCSNLSEIKINAIGLIHFMVNVLTAQYQLCLEKMVCTFANVYICICVYICILLYVFVFTYLYVYF